MRCSNQRAAGLGAVWLREGPAHKGITVLYTCACFCTFMIALHGDITAGQENSPVNLIGYLLQDDDAMLNVDSPCHQ